MQIRSAPAKHSPGRTIRNKSALYGFWDTLCGILMLHTKTLFSLSEVSELLAFAIKQEANRLKMKYQTDDPYEICRAMKIQVMKQPMGKNAKSCKGFFLVSSRCKLIMINSDLPESIQRIILVHELGHADLHSDSAISAFHEFTFLDDTDRMEYEANIFAAELLLNAEDVFEALQQQMDFFQTASCLCVPPELLDFKLRILQREGVEIKAPYIAHGDFLKRDLGQPLN